MKKIAPVATLDCGCLFVKLDHHFTEMTNIVDSVTRRIQFEALSSCHAKNF